jgi:serine/threonine-protein kinase
LIDLLQLNLSGRVFSRTEEITRFQNEAAAAARLHSPGIVGIHDIGEVAGRHFYSMELIEGGSLAEELRHGPVKICTSARLFAQGGSGS